MTVVKKMPARRQTVVRPALVDVDDLLERDVRIQRTSKPRQARFERCTSATSARAPKCLPELTGPRHRLEPPRCSAYDGWHPPSTWKPAPKPSAREIAEVAPPVGGTPISERLVLVAHPEAEAGRRVALVVNEGARRRRLARGGGRSLADGVVHGVGGAGGVGDAPVALPLLLVPLPRFRIRVNYYFPILSGLRQIRHPR